MRNIGILICSLLIVGLAACGEKDQEAETSSITLEMVDTPVDPVCKMNMTGLAISDTVTYNGKTYPFCKAGCKSEFDADPQAYVIAEAPQGHDHDGHDHDGHNH